MGATDQQLPSAEVLLTFVMVSGSVTTVVPNAAIARAYSSSLKQYKIRMKATSTPARLHLAVMLDSCRYMSAYIRLTSSMTLPKVKYTNACVKTLNVLEMYPPVRPSFQLFKARSPGVVRA